MHTQLTNQNRLVIGGQLLTMILVSIEIGFFSSNLVVYKIVMHREKF